MKNFVFRGLAQLNLSCNSAFTLAEVLITLGIIGIVAAMTLPALVANYQKKVYANQLKKVVNVTQNACKMALAQNEVSDFADTDLFSALKDNSLRANDKATIEKYFKVISYGYAPTGAHSHATIKFYNGNALNVEDDYVFFTLNDGTDLYLSNAYNYNNDYHPYYNPNSVAYTGLDVITDINGYNKHPNIAGLDLFSFSLDKNCNLKTEKTDHATVDGCGYKGNLHSPAIRSKYCFNGVINNNWEIKY